MNTNHQQWHLLPKGIYFIEALQGNEHYVDVSSGSKIF